MLADAVVDIAGPLTFATDFVLPQRYPFPPLGEPTATCVLLRPGLGYCVCGRSDPRFSVPWED